MDARICKSLEEFGATTPEDKGVIFHIKHEENGVLICQGLMIRCVGCGQESYLPLIPSGDNPAHCWNLLLENPLTIQPSVFHNNGTCGWHGWLKNGVWVPC